MGSGQSCVDQDGNPQDLVCPSVGGGATGGDAHLGSKTWHSETTSYVSVGLLNVYLSTTITSSGLLLGVFVGVLLTVSVWVGVHKRKQKLQRKKTKAKEEDVEKKKSLEESISKLMISSTGSHSTTWPAFRAPPGVQASSASAPLIPTTHQLVPLPWGQH